MKKYRVHAVFTWTDDVGVSEAMVSVTTTSVDRVTAIKDALDLIAPRFKGEVRNVVVEEVTE